MVGDIAEAVSKGERLIAEATKQTTTAKGAAQKGPRKRRQGLKRNLADAEDEHRAASKTWLAKINPVMEKLRGLRAARKVARAGAL